MRTKDKIHISHFATKCRVRFVLAFLTVDMYDTPWSAVVVSGRIHRDGGYWVTDVSQIRNAIAMVCIDRYGLYRSLKYKYDGPPWG